MSLQSNNRQRGKALQTKTAKYLDGLDVGTLGGEDVLHPLFSIECKSTKRFVGSKWFEQADRNNTRNAIPIVVAHVTSDRYKNDIVMIRIKDFKKLLEKGNINGLTIPQKD